MDLLNKHGVRKGRCKWLKFLQACCVLVCLLGLVGCKTSRKAVTGNTETAYLSSKVKLTIPHKKSVFTVNGSMKLRSKKRLLFSFLMPILRTEVARIELTPDEALLIDRMGKRYVRMTRSELRNILPKKADFAHLERMLFKASQPQAKHTLEGRDLGIPKLAKCRIELSDFSNKPFELTPTKLSSRYKEVQPEELLQLLSDLTK